MSDWLRYALVAVAVLAGVAVLARRRSVRTALVDTVDRLVPSLSRRRGRIALSVVAWLIIGLAVAAVTFGGLLWFLGWPRLPSTASFGVDQFLDLMKIALSVVAGFGGVVLLAVNYRKQRVTEDEHRLAVEKDERETVQRFNERLGKAAEQLAHESPAVRLTAVYSLAGLADDWVDKRQVCVDVLCGYLRLSPDEVSTEETEVQQAILRTFRDRLGRRGAWRWHELTFDFTGVRFLNADFSHLEFAGSAVFDGARFTGELTTFDWAAFTGKLSCHGTVFESERSTFTFARFDAGAEFVGTEFKGRELDCSGWRVGRGPIDFYRCRFLGELVDFSGMALRPGDVRFGKTEFTDARLDFDSVEEPWSEKDRRPRLVFEDVRVTRCRWAITPYKAHERMIWLIDCVLDSVDLAIDEHGLTRPRLNVHNLELRGGTTVPEAYVRRWPSE
ncbi:hypothetical protein VSH64_28855 [Amycolatopsis rhabdoformis]|uniref:Pentapeptide repeat-containing protein n=1 Tax=Amycolatopsis rhabdoformis TaxID=1448059 RepID=A0ABZ1HXK8_9PSEU|nr:hypothetical protein [Amycolatopsis rhabdoformis]WSE26880.1 hypothetical protein VSH64_28855 [Amycolatopsis rhabdoformis]